MNIAFWILTIAAIFFLWFWLAPWFRSVGGDLVNMYNRAKDEMSEEIEQKENEEDGK